MRAGSASDGYKGQPSSPWDVKGDGFEHGLRGDQLGHGDPRVEDKLDLDFSMIRRIPRCTRGKS